MHIPDGFLDAKTCMVTTVVGAAALSYAVQKTRFSRKDVPLVALVGSFIFAAQMVNFPVAGATSGHFLGGSLSAILFGPLTGMIIMASVLTVQALLFQDGGITVLGANILCTGFIGCYVGYGVYRTIMQMLKWQKAAAFLSGWSSIVVASIGVALLLGVSGTVPYKVALYSMVGWHSLIGIGEGLITAMVLSYLHERKMVHERLAK